MTTYTVVRARWRVCNRRSIRSISRWIVLRATIMHIAMAIAKGS